MNKLVIAVVLVVAMAIGCSQTEGATPLPSQVTPTVEATVAILGPTPLQVSTIPDPPVVSTISSPPATKDSNPLNSSTEPRQRPATGRRFVPLDDPLFLAIDQSEFADDELVLGVEWAGEARAYPVRMLRYHHIINDSVDGSPFLITY